MPTPQDPTSVRPVDAVIAAYLEAAESGPPPDRDDWLARHPDLAADLRAFFADLDRIEGRAAPLRLDADPDPTGDAPPHAPPHRVRYFGDYELLEEIARGGMGVVYRARQLSLNRIVALKMILKGALATPRDVQRFRAEAEAAASLDHPNIVPIYEIGEHEGQQYFSMKLIEGGSLAGRPRASPRTTVQGLSDVARAVHFAHQRGILHRDLKPSNILVDDAGTLFVTDFGLAKRLGNDNLTLTDPGQLVGTPRYMAPEQADGATDLTVAADVWALGAILYERLTGQPAFPGDTLPDILRRVRNAAPARPSAVQPGLDRDLEAVCLKCLEKDPVLRYPSAAALADDFDRWLRGEPLSVRRVGSAGRAWRWARRNPAVATLTTTVAVLVVTFAVGSSVAAVRFRRLADDERTARQATADALIREEAEKATVAKQRDDLNVALTHAEGLRLAAHSILERPNPTLSLLLALEAADRGRPRGPAHNHALVGAISALPAHRLYRLPPETEYTARMSPDGRRLLVFDESMRSGQNEIKEAARKARYRRVRKDRYEPWWYSPVLVDVATGQQTPLFRLPQGFLSSPQVHLNVSDARFSPDGKRVVTVFRGLTQVRYADGATHRYTANAVRVWDAETGKERTVLRGHDKRVMSAEFSPDGQRIVTAGHDGTVRLWDAETGKELAKADGMTDFPLPGRATFSPDGKSVVIVRQGLWQFAYDWRDSDKRPRVDAVIDPPMRADPPVVDYDWDYYHTVDAPHRGEGTTFQREVFVWDPAAGKTWPLAGTKQEKGIYTDVRAFSADGSRVALSGGSSGVWEVATGKKMDLPAEQWPAPPVRWASDYSVPGEPENPLGQSMLGKDGEAVRKGPPFPGVFNVQEGKTTWYAMTPDQKLALTLGTDATLRVFPAVLPPPYGHLLPTFGDPEFEPTTWRKWSPDNRVLSVIDRPRWKPDEPIAVLHDPIGGRPDVVFQTRNGRRTSHLDCVFTPDGRRLVMLFSEFNAVDAKIGPGPARMYDTATGQELYTLAGLTGEVDEARITSDGRWLVTGSTGVALTTERGQDAEGKPLTRHVYRSGPKASPDAGVRVWDMQTGELRWTLTTDRETYTRVVPGRPRAIVFAGDPMETATMYDLETGRKLFAFDGRFPGGYARFTADGTMVRLFTRDRRWAPYDTESGARRPDPPLAGDRYPERYEFVPGDRYVVQTKSLEDDVKQLIVRDVRTGDVRWEFAGKRVSVDDLSFSPDGRFLAVPVEVQDKLRVRIMEVASGREWMTLSTMAYVSGVAFSPDGQYLLTELGRQAWPVDPLPVAGSRKSRDLTAAERQRFGLPAPVPPG